MKKEGLFPTDLDQSWINSTVKKYIHQESLMLDWIFEEGELPHYTKDQLLSYMKWRIDNSLVQIGYQKVFGTTDKELEPFKWFEEEIYANTLDDFFAKRPVEYTKHDKSINAKDLF